LNTALFYDTETTGLPLFNEPSEDPRQPHIVQLAACLVDLDSRAMIAGLDVIVRPDGWTIPDDVAALHGITTERAADLGVGERAALNLFLDLWSCAGVRVAHNETFDARIIRIAIKRLIGDSLDVLGQAPLADVWKSAAAQCTARLATPVCALPPTEKMKAARRFHHKTPNLQEAHQHLLGASFDGAHSANADVQACMRVFFALEDLRRRSVSANDEATPQSAA